jgi:hypothetical protein
MRQLLIQIADMLHYTKSLLNYLTTQVRVCFCGGLHTGLHSPVRSYRYRAKGGSSIVKPFARLETWQRCVFVFYCRALKSLANRGFVVASTCVLEDGCYS